MKFSINEKGNYNNVLTLIYFSTFPSTNRSLRLLQFQKIYVVQLHNESGLWLYLNLQF